MKVGKYIKPSPKRSEISQDEATATRLYIDLVAQIFPAFPPFGEEYDRQALYELLKRRGYNGIFPYSEYRMQFKERFDFQTAVEASAIYIISNSIYREVYTDILREIVKDYIQEHIINH